MATSKTIQMVRTFEPDERQREAIEHVHGPMLVVAGAGTGKTTVLIRRIARLIREGHAQPDEILAVTYTDNAAAEMLERVQAELAGTNIARMKVSTFHAYCNNLLIQSGKSFGLLEDKDLWILLRRRIHELNLKHFIIAANVGKFLEDLLDFMRRCQDELVGPEQYVDYVARLERGELPVPRVSKSKEAATLSDEEVLGRCREIAGVFVKVERMLSEQNLGTFGHMITRAYDLLQNNPELLEQERRRAKFILVDEFQDANFAQAKILKLLAGEQQNVFAVGDPDQAIYRFRGASSAAFGLFHRSFTGTRLVALEKNRRSTTAILNCAYALISQNPNVFPADQGSTLAYKRSPLIAAREGLAVGIGKAPSPVEGVVLSGKDIESADVISSIVKFKKETRCRWKDFAVLYRIHSHRDELVVDLVDKEIPFVIENMDVMPTTEARDLFACLKAVVSTRDDASLLRVAALPQFAIDGDELRAGIRGLPRDQESGGVELVLTKISNGASVLNTLQDVRAEVDKRNLNSMGALELIIRQFNFRRTSPPILAVLDFVGKWEGKALTETKKPGELLEYLDLYEEARGTIPLPTTDADAVRLMTVHTAKGLEFNHVCILRVNSGQFPCSYRETLVGFPRELIDPDSIAVQDDKTLFDEEERRLFYVAMTRARDKLTLYGKQAKGKDPTPAKYLRELLHDTKLRRDLCQRAAHALQTDMFAQAAAPVTRIAEWLTGSPAVDLSARLSASAVQTYETCPMQFKLEREWRIPGEVPAAMQYGASMHRVLRTYYDSIRLERTMSEEAVLEFFRSDLRAANIQDPYQHELYEKQGVLQLKEFLRTSGREAPNVLHTEEFFDMPVGGCTVVGRIDRIDQSKDGQVTITDYKTGRAQSQEDADKSLQLSIYALAAREKWNYRAGALVLYNLGENSSVITRRDDGDLDGAKTRIIEVAESIAGGHFEPTPGFHCKMCAYRNLCPATEKSLYVMSGKQN